MPDQPSPYRSGELRIASGRYLGRFCAIDIGTVTCRMLIADAFFSESESIRIIELDKQYEVVNLGKGVDSSRKISEEALVRAECALREFVSVRDSFSKTDFPILSTTVVATSATRDAENSTEFDALLSDLGLQLNVISGVQEAALSFAGASCAYSGEKVVVIDVGGGSTEISAGSAGDAPFYSRSFDVGCRRMTERFWDGYPCSRQKMKEAREWAHQAFSEIPPSVKRDNERLLAVAGTATSVVSIEKSMEVYDPQAVNGCDVGLEQLQRIERRLSSLDIEGLQAVAGLDPRRAPVIVGGLIILEEAMEVLGCKTYTASESDILEGIVRYNATQHIAS